MAGTRESSSKSGQLSGDELNEAIKATIALDTSDLEFSRYDQWLQANSFSQCADKRGTVYTYEGTNGFVQLEFIQLDQQNKVVRCVYIPLRDRSNYIWLANEGVTSHKSLSVKDLEALQRYRCEYLEWTVLRIVGEDFALKKVELQTPFKDLELDELDVEELVMAVEDKFGCEIPDEDVRNFKTVEDVVSSIRKQKADCSPRFPLLEATPT
jgi:acyl carrier protein